MERWAMLLEYVRVAAWPLVCVVLVLWFRRPIGDLLRRVRKAEAPGGWSAEFAEGVERVGRLAEAAAPVSRKGPRFLQPEDVARLVEALGERRLPSRPTSLELAYYGELVDQDPNLALAGLRMALETDLRNMAVVGGVQVRARASAVEVARRLHEEAEMPTELWELVRMIANVCSNAVHGAFVPPVLARRVVDSAGAFRDYYGSWLQEHLVGTRG